MLLEEFHNPLGVSACSFQSGDAVEEVGLCNAAERVSPGFVCLPYAFERTSMGGAEIRPVGFAGLTADGTGAFNPDKSEMGVFVLDVFRRPPGGGGVADRD